MKLYPTLVEKYLDHPTCSIRAQSTRRNFRSIVRDLQFTYPDLELHELEAHHIEQFLGSKLKAGVADSTVDKYLSRFKTLFDWTSWQGLVQSNPAEHLRKSFSGLHPQAVREHHWLTADQVARVLDSIDTTTPKGMRDALVLRLGFTAGLRSNEITSLPMSALNQLDQQKVTIIGKNRKLAQVWVPEKTQALLQEWKAQYEGAKPTSSVVVRFRNQVVSWEPYVRELIPQWGEPLGGTGVTRVVTGYTEREVYRIAPHDMRRSFAGILLDKGVDIYDISKALRHSNVGITERYLESRVDAAYQAGKNAGVEL